MRFHGGSFLFGVATAAIVPVLTRFFRPVAVQLTTAGMIALDDARRVAAEQLEVMQDIAAEARLRREELLEAEPAERRRNGRGRTTKRRRGAAPTEPSEKRTAGGSEERAR